MRYITLLVVLLVSGVLYAQTPPLSVVQNTSPPIDLTTMVLSIITSIVALIGTMFTGLIAYMIARLNSKAEQVRVIAAVASEQSKDTLKVANDIHTLVNSNMRVALQANATMARRIADITGRPGDDAEADKAAKAVVDHDLGQAQLDKEKADARRDNE